MGPLEGQHLKMANNKLDNFHTEYGNVGMSGFCFLFYILIREGIRFMQNVILSNVHVLRPFETEKVVFANVSVCVSV